MYRLLFALLLMPVFLVAQRTMSLSPEAKVSVLTMDPGQYELYAAFGHSAIRIEDPFYRLDKVYNYGVFDFNQPNFYWNFAKGNLNYMLGTAEYNRFVAEYRYYQRSIRSQELNLTAQQKQALFSFLEKNALPTERNYRYDYFYNNCATKIRDVLKEVLKEEFVIDQEFTKEKTTIRKKTDEYLKYQPWGDFGIDLGLGLPMDVTMTPEMFLFLPDYVEKCLNSAHIYHEGKKHPAVLKSKVLYQAPETTIESSYFTPFLVFWLLFVLCVLVTILDLRRKAIVHKWFDVVLFSILGLLGLLLSFLWFFTDHAASANNMNLMWALPFHLVIPFFLFKKKKPSWLKFYFLLTIALAGILFLFWWVLPQQIHYALSPVFLIIILRSWINSKDFSKF